MDNKSNKPRLFLQCCESFLFMQVEFYVSQTKADNHAVREAACECIAELGIKVNDRFFKKNN